MNSPEAAPFRLHEDPPWFLEAVNATAAATGFAPRLVERDYFCTVLLRYLAPLDGALVFKGGTCLAKVHAGFYRLSEDLDFLIPTPTDASRAVRRRQAQKLKGLLGGLGSRIPGIQLSRALEGANESAQYTAVLSYRSLLNDTDGSVRFEVGLREPLLTHAVQGKAKTLLLDPLSGSELVPVLEVPCLSREEAMAEKLRAALCRREAAIRDFYDIDHAVRRLGFRLDDPEFIGLVQQKLTVPGNQPPDVSAARLDALRPQVETELSPVLRTVDFAAFDLERAFATVAGIAGRLSP